MVQYYNQYVRKSSFKSTQFLQINKRQIASWHFNDIKNVNKHDFFTNLNTIHYFFYRKRVFYLNESNGSHCYFV